MEFGASFVVDVPAACMCERVGPGQVKLDSHVVQSWARGSWYSDGGK